MDLSLLKTAASRRQQYLRSARAKAARRTTVPLARLFGYLAPATFGFWMARQVPLSRVTYLGIVPVGLVSGWLLRSWRSVALVPLCAFGGYSLSISTGRGWGGVWKVVRFPVLITLIVALFSPAALFAAIGTWLGKRTTS